MPTWKLFIALFAPSIPLLYLALSLTENELVLSSGLVTVFDVLSFSAIYLWMYLLGLKLYDSLDKDLKERLNARLFKAVFFYLATYGIVAILCSLAPDHFVQNIKYLTVPTSLCASFSLFYIPYFVSKYIIAHEKRVFPEFKDYVEILIQIWFLPIGIWFLQPRIRKLLDESSVAP